jgi:hypothetical protein
MTMLTKIKTIAQDIQLNGAYGDIKALAAHAGINYIHARLKGEWQHGWIPPERNIHPELVIGSCGSSRLNRRSNRFYVARHDQVTFLKKCGYLYVEAIGHPILYVPKPTIPRIPGSLLIMPVHSTIESKTGQDQAIGAYIEYIESIKDKFTEVSACIHQCDLEYYRNLFDSLGIPIIEGAHENDQNSYARMAALGSTFEYMTTNGFGSHVAYLSYFGARVSVAGPKPEIDYTKIDELIFYKNCPECIRLIKSATDRISCNYSFLARDPWLAPISSQWASKQLGEEYKITSSEAGEVLFLAKPINPLTSKIKFKIRLTLSKLTPRRIKLQIKQLKNRRKLAVIDRSNILSFAFRTQTHLTQEELLCLAEYSSTLPPKAIGAEIGSYLGASAIATCAGLKNDAKLFCIDTWQNHNMQYTDEEHEDQDLAVQDTFDIFIANTKICQNHLLPVRKWSNEAIADLVKTGMKLNWLFIDGDHSYEGVSLDWRLYSKILAKESLVVFHDTGWAEGVNQVIRESVANSCILEKSLPNMKVFRFAGEPAWDSVNESS